MSTKPGIFEPVKQPGKVVTSFASGLKQSQVNLRGSERDTSPFRGYKNDTKGPDYGVSRGIFTGMSKDLHNSDIFGSHRSMSGDLDNKSQVGQQVQEIMQQEFKNLIAQWRSEIFEEVNNSIKEYKDKTTRNRETIDMIKQHLKVNTQSMNEIDSKLADYDTKLVNIGTLIQQEIEGIKASVGNLTMEDKQYEKLEQRQNALETSQQASLLGLKQEILNELSADITEFNESHSKENNSKFQKLKGELSEALEGKLTKVVDHLSNKIGVIENQIKNMEKAEDPEIEKVKYEIENKLQESSQSLREQMIVLSKLIETSSSESAAQNGQNSKAISQAQVHIEEVNRQLELINSQTSKNDQNVKELQEYFENKTNEFEDRWQEQFGKLEGELRSCSDEIQTLVSRLDNVKFDNNMNLLMKINTLNNELETLTSSQKQLQVDLTKQEQSLEGVKTLNSATISDIQKKSQDLASSSALVDPRIKRLEEQVESLSRMIDNLKSFPSNLTSSPGTDSTSTTYDRFRVDSVSNSQNLKGLSQPYSNSRNLSPLRDDVLYHHPIDANLGRNDDVRSQQPTWNYSSNSQTRYSPPSKYGDRKIDEIRNYEGGSYYSNTSLLNKSPEPYLSLSPTINSIDSNSHQKDQTKPLSPNRIPEIKMDISPKRSFITISPKNTDRGFILQERKRDIHISPERAHEYSNEKQPSLSSYEKNPLSPLQSKRTNSNNQRSNEKSPPRSDPNSHQDSDFRASFGISSGGNPSVHKISGIQNPHEDDEEVEVVYQLDENGFLMDEDGNYILDEQGQPIKLNEDHIERLRANNLLEEEN